MGLGPYIYTAWFVVMLASLAVAVVHLVRERPQRLRSSLAAMIGGLLSWFLVSAYIGACESHGYWASWFFAIALTLGMAGLLLLAWSCMRLIRTPAGRPERDVGRQEMNIDIRRFREGDADDISVIVCRNLREVNAKDYSPGALNDLVASFTPEKIRQLATGREMFVAETAGRIVGTASLARDNRTPDERYVCLTVFVLPEKHGCGIGKKLMDHVEAAARSKGAQVLLLPASLTAQPFYRRRGYTEDATVTANPKDAWVWMTKKLEDAR